MKNTLKKLFMVGLTFALAVTPVSAKEFLDKEIPENAYGISKFVAYGTGGTRTVSNVIVKNGVAFVSGKELAKVYNLIPNITEDMIIFSINSNQLEYAPKDIRVSYSFRETNPKMDKNRVSYTLYNNDDIINVGKSVSKYSQEGSSNLYNIMIDDNSVAFYKDNDVYVPAKLTIQCLNQNANTPVTYNAKTNTITFQDELCAPIVKCIGYCYKDGYYGDYYGHTYF